jgi:hypothetical protein
MLVEAAMLTSCACLALSLLPFRWIAPWLGGHMQVTPQTQLVNDRFNVQRVGTAIRRASRNLPWKAQCLAQVIAATAMLRLRGIEGTVYLGVAKEGDQNLIAHAWLRSGSTIVTGAEGLHGHSVIATFAFPKR